MSRNRNVFFFTFPKFLSGQCFTNTLFFILRSVGSNAAATYLSKHVRKAPETNKIKLKILISSFE